MKKVWGDKDYIIYRKSVEKDDFWKKIPGWKYIGETVYGLNGVYYPMSDEAWLFIRDAKWLMDMRRK